MAAISSRDDFKKYCLRKLGAPVIEINIDDDQLEDRVTEAISYYWDYHFDGAEKTYYKVQVTSTDITNRYITIPDNIIGVVNIFPVGNALSTNNMFNLRYQIALNDLYTLTSQSMVPYVMSMQHLQWLEQILVGQQPLRYNRIIGKCYIDMDWNVISPGQYLILEAYQVVDPEVFTKGYNERWLQNYASVLVKEQWGSNLKKFEGMTLPGGLKFNGQKIYDEARQERLGMEQEMITGFSMPVYDMIG